MYCSVHPKVMVSGEGGFKGDLEVEVGVSEEREGAVKSEGYHCERKPWSSSVSRQKKRGSIAGEGRRCKRRGGREGLWRGGWDG